MLAGHPPSVAPVKIRSAPGRSYVRETAGRSPQARLLDHYQQHALPLRTNLTRATLANLVTVAGQTSGGLTPVSHPDYLDRYCIARLGHPDWPAVTVNGGGAIVPPNHTWI
jgi:hypothetical protein